MTINQLANQIEIVYRWGSYDVYIGCEYSTQRRIRIVLIWYIGEFDIFLKSQQELSQLTSLFNLSCIIFFNCLLMIIHVSHERDTIVSLRKQ